MWERSIREVGELVDFSTQARTRGQRIELARRAEPTGVLMGWLDHEAGGMRMGISHSQGAPAEHKIHLSMSLPYDIVSTTSAYSTVQNTYRTQKLESNGQSELGYLHKRLCPLTERHLQHPCSLADLAACRGR